MIQYFTIPNESGHPCCKLFSTGGVNKPLSFPSVVIVTHGFGSNKDSAATERFAKSMLQVKPKWAVLAFDWVAHGSDEHERLTVKDNLNYIQLVTDYAKNQLQAENIYIYSTSFGGYLTLRYLIEMGDPFARIALCCPAIPMYDTMRNDISKEDIVKVASGEDILVGYERKMLINAAYLESLRSFDVRDFDYSPFAAHMLLLQGTADQIIPFKIARAFAKDNNICFIPVIGADHFFAKRYYLNQIITRVVHFFAKAL